MDAKLISKFIRTVSEQMHEHNASIESHAMVAAITDMMPHWKSHLADGESPEILVTDLKALEGKVREFRKLLEESLGLDSTSTMQVSLDGGETFEPVKFDVRVSYSDVNVMMSGEDESGQVDIVLTHEGLITDVWVSREGTLDHNIGTSSQTLEDIQEELIEQND